MLDKFPTILFQQKRIVDISKVISIKDLAKEADTSIYFKYTLKTWRSPENVAYDFYGTCDMVYLVYIANNIVDPFTEWLLRDEELKRYVVQKYGEDHIYDVHHYVTKDGNIVNDIPNVANVVYKGKIADQDVLVSGYLLDKTMVDEDLNARYTNLHRYNDPITGSMVDSQVIFQNEDGSYETRKMTGTAAYFTPVSNMEYEISENEKRRTINIIHPELIAQINELIEQKMSV